MDRNGKPKDVRFAGAPLVDCHRPPLLAPLLKLLARLESRSDDELCADPQVVTTAMDAVVRHALRIVSSRLRAHGVTLTRPEAVREYLRLLLAGGECEVFAVLFLDSQHRLIHTDEMFRGTLAQTSVYPREVVKAALKCNAAAVIFAHNHPSGVAEPSRADELLTQALKQALALVDVRVLDHFVVAGSTVVSFAERGLL
jgi:DNA repair protein RadC